ncbi:MAG: hypothetical protein KDJ27_19180 [Gammaproteobacteria bacterium]|nr:hypothetical protein [Gammaproteobacteria bacterium]
MTRPKKASPWARTFPTPEDLGKFIAGYIAKCDAENRPPTMSRAALEADLRGRQAWPEIAEQSEGHAFHVDRLRAYCSAALEEAVITGKGGTALTMMLANHGWELPQQRIKQEIDQRVVTDMGREAKAALLSQMRSRMERARPALIEGECERVEEESPDEDDMSWAE